MKSLEKTVKTKPREVRGRIVKMVGKSGVHAAYFASDKIRMMKAHSSVHVEESKPEGDAVSNAQKCIEKTIQTAPYRAYKLTAMSIRMTKKYVKKHKKRKEKAATHEHPNIGMPSSSKANDTADASAATQHPCSVASTEQNTNTRESPQTSLENPKSKSKKRPEAARKTCHSAEVIEKENPLADSASRPLSAREIAKGREKYSQARRAEQASAWQTPSGKKTSNSSGTISTDTQIPAKHNDILSPRIRLEPSHLCHQRPKLPLPKPREVICQPVKDLHIIVHPPQKTVKSIDSATRIVAKQQAAFYTTISNVHMREKARQISTKNAERVAKHMAELSRKAAKHTKRTLSSASKAAIRATIAAGKALTTMFAAGGWIIVLIIIVLLMCVCILASPFGIFTHTDATEFPDSITLDKAITTINAEYVDEIESRVGGRSDTIVAIEGNLEGEMEPVNWVDVLAVYSVHLTMRKDNAMDVVQLDNTKIQELRNVFWDMNRLSTETGTDENGNTVRYILGTSRSYLEMADIYHFTNQQRQMLDELMSDNYYAFWSNFVSESMGYGSNDWTGVTTVGDYKPSMSGSVMNIPKLYQFDYRQTICVINGKRKSVSTSGCGATSMSMVIRYLTGNTKQTPYTLFKWAYQNGHYSGDGLGHSAISKMGNLYGVSGSWVGKDGKRIISALKAGHPVIAHMGPGIFTKQGHYIVLRGVTDDGKILVNDPNSKSRSGKAYPLSTILNQSKTSEPFMICSVKTN